MTFEDYKPVQTGTIPSRLKVAAIAWRLVNATAFRYSPFFSRGWRRLLLRAFGADIHHTTSANRLAVIDYPWNLRMGAWSSLGPHSWTYALAPITIGAKTCVGDGVRLLTGSHDIEDCQFGLLVSPIAIGSCCWVATGATVLPGVTIGEGAVVGACAVVTKDVPAWTVVAGNPAREVKKRVMREERRG